MSNWIFVILNISSCQIWRNWDVFVPSLTVPKWKCLAGSKVWQRCFRDQGRQLRDVLWFRQCGGLNGVGERANWQPCATLNTVWLASACVSVSLSLSPTEHLVVYFGRHLCKVCLCQQLIQKWKEHLLIIKLWFIQTLLMELGLRYTVSEIFAPKYSLAFLVNRI